MSAWKAFYEGREGHDYLNYVKQRYAPFIAAINARIRTRDFVLELGAGTGTITKALVDGKLKVHADGFSGPLKIMPLVTNEILVEIGER